MSYTIAHHCDFSPGSPPLCKQQGSSGVHKSSRMDLAQSGHPFGHFCSLPLAGNQPIVSGGVGSKNGPMCGCSVGGGGGEAERGVDYVLGGPAACRERFCVFTLRSSFMNQPAGRATSCQSEARYSLSIFRKISPYKQMGRTVWNTK